MPNKEVKVLYKESNEKLGYILLIRSNPLYPSSIEIIEIENNQSKQYLLPERAFIEATKNLTGK